MAARRDPFEGKSNQECIDLIARAIETCKDEAKKANDDFQTDLDTLINESRIVLDQSPHYQALIKSFRKIAEELEQREKDAMELVRVHAESLIKMKQVAKFAYDSNLQIAILNKELNRRLNSLVEYDPASVPSTSSATKIDLSLSSNAEDNLLKSNTSEISETQQSAELSQSAEIRELQKIPLPDENVSEVFSVPTPPPLPTDEVSPRTAERFDLRPFSVVLEEKAGEIVKSRHSKCAATSDLGSKKTKVRKTTPRKRSPIPKIKINVKSLTKVDKRVTRSNKLVSEQEEDELKKKEEFLEKMDIVARSSSDRIIGSEIPQCKEGVENEANLKLSESEERKAGVDLSKSDENILADTFPKDVDVYFEDGLRKLERRLKNSINGNESMESDFLDIESSNVANSTEKVPQNAGFSLPPVRKRILDSPHSSLEKSPYRESSKRPHRSSSLGDLNMETALKSDDFKLLFDRLQKPKPTSRNQDEKPQSILKKRHTEEDRKHDSSERSSSPSVERPRKKLSPSHRIETPKDSTRRSPTGRKYDSLIITKKIGSNDELSTTRSVTSVSSVPSTSKVHEPRSGSSNREKLFDGGRIPKKTFVLTPPPPPPQPRIPLRSDPGWIMASIAPQKQCFILKVHDLAPAEFERPRNHIYERLNDNDPDSLVHVTLRRKNGLMEDFIAESTFGWPGVPHLPYELTRQIIPPVISSGFAFGRGLVREKDRRKLGYKKWERMLFDPFLKYSFCSITILDLEETKVVTVDEERFKIEWIRNAHLPVFTHQIAEITLQSDTTNERADFTFQIHLVDMVKSGHFGINRIILGQDFLERYLVSADGSMERGHLFFENRATPPRFYKTTFHPKREERYGK